jgi:hypothetical protein
MANTQQIEERIDRQVAGAIALNPAPRNMLTIAPTNMSELFEFAKMMAVSGECIPKCFRDKPGACLAIALQAFRNGADPFAVANKAYLVNDRVAYEAQYINSVLNCSPVLSRRLRATFDGEGQTLRCRVVGWISDEPDPFEYTSPPLGSISPKNSPLWKTDPEQQLYYYSSRAWARRYAPEVTLGMDTGEDIQGQVIDVTPPPRPQREDFVEPQKPAEPWFLVYNEVGEEEEFEHAADAVERVIAAMGAAARSRGRAGVEAVWENNDAFIDRIDAVDNISAHYDALLAEFDSPPQTVPPVAAEARDGREVQAPAASAAPVEPASVRDAPEADREAADEPQSAPPAAVPATDIVAELGRKLTAAAQKGRRELDKAWLGLSDLERDLARPMRAQYREIAAQAEV